MRFQNNRAKRLITTCFICLLCTTVEPEALADDNLPLLGDPVSSIVSPQDEIVLGRAYLRALRGQLPIIQDPPLNAYIQQLTSRIVAATAAEVPPINIAVINSSAINAFAVPGGVLGVNAGLFLYTASEAELAAIIAHEIAHLTQRHYARGVEHREKTKWTTYTGLLASLALLATSDSSTGIASILATQAAAMDANLQFSRQNEREADRVGMETLHTAGFDPRAMPSFFGRLLKSKQFSGVEDYEFLATHPVTKSRISDSQARADQLTHRFRPRPESSEFDFMQTRVVAAYTATPQEAVAQFKAKLDQDPDSVFFLYGLARAYIRNQQLDEADKLLSDWLQKNNTSHTSVVALELALAQIEILLEKKSFNQAKQKIQTLRTFYPTHTPLLYYQGQAEIGLSNFESAKAIFQTLLDADPENTLFLENMLVVQRKRYDEVGTLVAQANLSFAKGKYSQSATHYQKALSVIPQSNLPMRGKIEFEIQKISQLIEKLQQFSR